MGSIPLGDFQQARVVPRTQESRVNTSPLNVAGTGAAALGEAIGRTGQMLGQMAIGDEQKRSDESDALARAKAANALAMRQLEIQALVDKREQALRQGGDYTKVGEEYDADIAKLPAIQIEGLKPASLEAFNGGLANAAAGGRLKLGNAITVARRDDGQRQMGTLFDTLGKTASMPGADVDKVIAQGGAFVKELAPQFEMDGSTTEAKFQAWKDGLWQTQVTQRFTDAGADITALKTLQADLTDGDGFYATRMDPQQRAVAASSVASRIMQVENAARVEADKRETVAAGVVKDMQAQVAAGIPPTPDTLASWMAATKGTSHEAEAIAGVKMIGEVAEVRRMAPAAQQKYIADREARLNTGGGSPLEKSQLATLRAALENDQKQMADDPLQYVRNMTGKEAPPLPFDKLQGGDVGAVTTALADRVATLAALRRGGMPVAMKPLKTEEVTQLTSVLSGMPPERLVEVYAPLRAAAGSEDTYAAIMAQIAPGAPLQAYAGGLAVQPGGRHVAEMVLRGERLLAGKDGKTFAMPPAKEFELLFAEDSGNAYQGRPEARQRDLAAAKAVYAASVSSAGKTGADGIDERAFEASMRAIRGGGGVAEIGGQQTITPWGMDPDDFEDQAEPQIEAALRDAGLDPGLKVSLMATDRPGQYVLIQGRSPVFNPKAPPRADGRQMPVFFQFRRAPKAR